MLYNIAIIGGGISGLSTAYYLKQLSLSLSKPIGKIILLESSNKFGGCIKTNESHKKALHEIGPRSLRSNNLAALNSLILVNDLNLTDDLVYSNSKNIKNKFIWLKDGLFKVPNTILGALMVQKPFTESFIKLLYKEFNTESLNYNLKYPLLEQQEEYNIIKKNFKLLNQDKLFDYSVYNFFKYRFSQEFADFIVDPLCRGISANDSKKISIRSMFPVLFEGEKNYSSIVNTFFNEAKINKENSMKLMHHMPYGIKKVFLHPQWSFKDGLQQLPESLFNKLSTEKDVDLFLNSKVNEIEFKNDNKVKLIVSDSSQKYEIECDHIFSSINAQSLSKIILNDYDILKSTLNNISSNNVVTINFEFDDPSLVKKYQAFGVLIPSYIDPGTLGFCFDSNIFPEHDRGLKITRITAMMGGDWFKEILDSNGLFNETYATEKALEYLQKVVGINQSPSYVKVNLLENCIPSYKLGHYLKIDLLNKEIKEKNLKISLIGSSYKGISVNDCIYNAKSSVEDYLNCL